MINRFIIFVLMVLYNLIKTFLQANFYMSLIDEIIKLASDESVSLGALLRKCLILAHKLQNISLKEWAAAELNGYSSNADLPDYRIVRASAKGLLLGALGGAINGQPLAPGILKPEHQQWARTAYLRQPIVAYTVIIDAGGKAESAQIAWPASLVLMYQSDVMEGYALNRAWQEIPASVIIGLQDIVRTKVLQFALELSDDMRDMDDPAKIPAAKVENHITNIIMGGHNIIAAEAQGFSQVSNVTVIQNDLASLAAAFKSIGIEGQDFKALETALKEDKQEGDHHSIGNKAAGWVASIGKTVGREGLKVAIDVGKAAALAWIKQHLGSP